MCVRACVRACVGVFVCVCVIGVMDLQSVPSLGRLRRCVLNSNVLIVGTEHVIDAMM